MRKELYKAIADRLFLIASDGSIIDPEAEEQPERLIK